MKKTYAEAMEFWTTLCKFSYPMGEKDLEAATELLKSEMGWDREEMWNEYHTRQDYYATKA